MSLKTIKPKHREIMRRILMYQPMDEISKELQVSVVYLNMLMRDPLFTEHLEEMEKDVHEKWKANRLAAMDILEDSASKAAKLCVNAVDGVIESLGIADDGEVKTVYEIVPLKQRLDSAWDVLNRTGNKAIERKVVAHTTLQEMIITAYQQRTEKVGGGKAKALAPSSGSDNATRDRSDRANELDQDSHGSYDGFQSASEVKRLSAPKASMPRTFEDDDGEESANEYDPFRIAGVGNA